MMAAVPLVARLRAAPITVPCLGAVALLVWFAADQGGYPVSSWAPAGIAVLALLAIAAVSLRPAWARAPRPVRVAIMALAAYAGWCLLSLLWADNRPAAWEDSLRTVVYLAMFALFALWPQRAETAAVLLGLWSVAVGVIAAGIALKLMTDADATALLPGGRLTRPTGYPNASAALMLMAALPALLLASSRAMPWAARGLLAGVVVLCVDAALLAQSRGALLSLPVVAILLIVLVPGRLRTLTTALPIAAAVGAVAPSILHLSDRIAAAPERAALSGQGTGRAIVLGALLAAVVVAGAGALERHRPSTTARRAQVRRAGTVAYGVGAVMVVIAGLAVAGNPLHRIDHAWHSFKGGYTEYRGPHLASGLGSNRYDFYRVALDEFADHPIAGVGAGNFYEDYLRAGRSPETPRYPHSIGLRILAQTGLVGALLLVTALAAAIVAALRGVSPRGSPTLATAAAGGGLLCLVYWLVHGSVDWLYEYAGLGAAAFAFLGLAAALAPCTAPAASPVASRVRWVPVAGVGLLAAIALVGLWASGQAIERAGRVYARDPGEAYNLLRRAAWMNPFASQPSSIAGGVAVRQGDLARADREFAEALRRAPRDQYLTLERGAVQSALGRRAPALVLLRRAHALAPRDALTSEALAVVRSGGRLDLTALDRRIAQASSGLR
jgi:O-antigen ligase